MEVNLAVEGLKFMVVGMSVVFSFLALLVLVINIQAKVLNKFFPEKPKMNPKKSPAIQENNEEEVVAAIIGAITTHRKK